MRKAFLSAIAILFLAAARLSAQTPEPEMADSMRSNGKIYVVVLVLAAIFAGITVYLIRLERKINKVEKTNN